MQLSRFQNTKIYTSGVNFFIYWKNNSNAPTLQFNDSFIQNAANNWVLLFHENLIDHSKLDEIIFLNVLSTLDDQNAVILWVDDFAYKNDLIDRCRKIFLNKNVISDSTLEFEQNQLLNTHKFSFFGFGGAIISILSDKKFLIKRNDAKVFTFKVNRSNCFLASITIGLTENTSCINFSSHFDQITKSLSISLPYLSKKLLDDQKEPVVTANFFDAANLVGCVLEADYFPFQKTNQSTFKIAALKKNKSLKTNLIDVNGQNLETTEIENLTFSFSKVVVDEQNPLYNRYILSPTDGQINTNQNNSLVGYSGTEMLALEDKSNTLSISFAKTKDFFVDENKIDIGVYNQKSEVGTFTFVNNAKYNLDTERSPLFDNAKKVTTLGDTSLEIQYAPLYVSDLPANTKIPILPTLAFGGSEELKELEKIFTQIRINRLPKTTKLKPKIGNSKFVTPQGFLRDGNKIDFIKPYQRTAKSGLVDNFQFSIDGVGANSDFYLSLGKAEVFFVLTPAMLEARPEVLQATFMLEKFKVELASFNAVSTDPTKEKTYLIFKFGKKTFNELLEDTTKWSNYGHFKTGADQNLISEILKVSTFPNTNDYAYFNNTIKNDPNWNGLIILNIPISDPNQLPDLLNGLTSSQELDSSASIAMTGEKRKFKTGLKFQYVAFQTNRTFIDDGEVNIKSTSFFGLIDYDLLNDKSGAKSVDYDEVSKHFPDKKKDIVDYSFLLTKLLVRFENSAIHDFKSFAFLQVPKTFDDDITIDPFKLVHPNISIPGAVEKDNFIRLEGSIEANGKGTEDIRFTAQSNLKITFDDGRDHKSIIKSITVTKVSFTNETANRFRFDINATADTDFRALKDIISIDDLKFENIGFGFEMGSKLPKLDFDVSRLLVFPKINFNGKGFLSSFPIKFSYFDTFKFKKTAVNSIKIDYDFFTFPSVKVPNIGLGLESNLFSFVFDFDLGTLGNLSALKDLTGQLLMGWSAKGGFALGFKLNGPSTDGLHLNLFGGLKLDVKELDYGKFKPKNFTECNTYFLRLNDARITIFGKPYPSEKNVFSGIIITNFSTADKKIAWLITYEKKDSDLVLALGQRMGPPINSSITTTVAAIDAVKDTFKIKLKELDPCNDSLFYDKINFRPERNWIVASESIVPKDWPLDLKFIFNDPSIYGLYLALKGEFLKGFSIDILYKKLAENLGVYTAEIQLPDELRNQELGGGSLTLPNIGIEIYTNGDWKVDIGFPRSGNDWRRSGFIQLRTAPPFVGFFGFYMMMSKIASVTLFKGYVADTYSTNNLQIIQAGFALRVGLGYYLNKGILYAGASITVYGILEGAFAFEKGKGLEQVFPDHFAVLGRTGAIAELIGYVDFRIVKASVHISLSAEFGMLMVYIGNDRVQNDQGNFLSKGIQPVLVYIEGNVTVKVTIKVGCVKIRLKFHKTLRFEYTIGGGSSNRSALALQGLNFMELKTLVAKPKLIIHIKGIKAVPMIYIPAFSKVNEEGVEVLKMIHYFMIPFFGKNVEKDADGEVTKVIPSNFNILKDKIILPFFNELIAQLTLAKVDEPGLYDTLRRVLVTGEAIRTVAGVEEKIEIDIKLDAYIPTFIQGINSQDKKVVNDILKTHFGFDAAELKPDSVNDNSITVKYEDEHLLIPAPIGKNIQIVDENNQVILPATKNGFDISVEGLVQDDAGNTKISAKIGTVNYNEDVIDYMEDFFDDYKTQFLERREKSLKLKTAVQDIREEIIIPEFFKLVALLTLEAFHNDTNPKHEKGTTEYNPIVSLDANGNFSYDNGKLWETNNALTEIVGQLNYFYNSGLRLPTVLNDPTTKSIYSILKQEEIVKPLTTVDLKDIKVSVNNVDLTKNVYADDKAKTAMLQLIKGFGPGFSFDELKKEFKPIKFTRPFKLMPVSLAIQNGKLAVKDRCRFFEFPKKLAQQSSAKARYAFEINYANYKVQVEGKDVVEYTTKDNSLKGFSKCLNISIKVKKHSKRILEVVNVFADDLNLMNALHNDNFDIDKIDFYYQHEPAANGAEEMISLDELTTDYATILKTNLSPRTAPPLFNELSAAFLKKGDDDRKYWDDSNQADKSNFIRLVWESLTTNNGGYFLILDKDAPKFDDDSSGKELETGTVILSLAGKKAPNTAIPAYFNAFKLDLLADPINATIMAGLTANTHYFYLDEVIMSNEVFTNKKVLEYYPTIPAHNLGLEVIRDVDPKKKLNYHNYLPLEFNLSKKGGAEILSADKILPIMPTNKNDQDDNQLTYNHISPLVIQDKIDVEGKNLKRYDEIGNTFSININLRDVFGYRTNSKGNYIASADYTHYYFDKLVQIEAWPLIRFSYWFKGYVTGKLQFELSCNCDIREILDMAGIDKIKDVSNPADVKLVYKYKKNDIIAKDDVKKLGLVIPGVLNNLYTIYAQLTDKKVIAEINGLNAAAEKIKWISKIQQLIEELTFILIEQKFPDTKITSNVFTVEHATSFKLKKELGVQIILKRTNFALHTGSNDMFKPVVTDSVALADLTEPYIWDYDATHQIASYVKLLNPKAKNNSKIKDLNDAIKSTTASAFCLGISTEIKEDTLTKQKLSEKILYLINGTNLAAIRARVNNKTFDEASYFGIKPFSNKLWSGDYTPSFDSNYTTFANVDLDKSLKAVLDKIDQLLKADYLPDSILPNGTINPVDNKIIYNNLLIGKKTIVEEKLKTHIDWVMKDEPITAGMTKEFRDLLLSNLSSFYAYDGMIKTSCSGLDVLKEIDSSGNVKEHRLTINFKQAKDSNYNLVSSKLGNHGEEWYIMFDQHENLIDNINFSVKPEITHIECDYESLDPDDIIQQSTWIQLISPVALGDSEYLVKDWKKITREFPDKPQIIKHQAVQMYKDGDPDIKYWNPAKIGLWNYEFGVNDVYTKDDIVNVELHIQSTDKSKSIDPEPNIEGFIAYWSSNILKLDIKSPSFIKDLNQFVDDLNDQLNILSLVKTGALKDVETVYTFELQKLGASKWKIKKIIDPINVVFKDNVDTAPNVLIGPFDILKSKDRVVSVTPFVKIRRNFDVGNPEFHYVTETVTPSNAATPQLKYFAPIRIESESPKKVTLDSVYTLMAQMELPYKSTAKLLINTADLDQKPTTVLPVIPIRQMEFLPTGKPNLSGVIPIDKMFETYANGYPSISLTIYNDGGEDDLPIFFADNIYKQKQ
ncbi:hypothetical protein DBR40_21725 [Pedobacter sp. KBW01]|uniref:hypothetical protein n=1 Tax=Pedobacter sp. KBW01 TaxID=2153364 RepID=UPI000F596203|nr:hypothetical protein [Pedobacter sp. KBW01]RQO66874.1 hypothetical protein DBR40_21725 [Pedobacter sp. KBW01]